MKGSFFLLLLLSCSTLISQAQNLDSILSVYAKDQRYDTLTYTLCKNKKWVKKFKTKTFKHQGRLHSYYLEINDDSTFVFQAFYEPGIDMAVGKWHKVNDSIINITWNREATLNIFKSKKEYRKYSAFSPSLPIKIDSWTFIIRKRVLLPIRSKDEVTLK